MSKEITLKDLCGLKTLEGIDICDSRCDDYVKITLSGSTYIIYKDHADGYRSRMGEIVKLAELCKNILVDPILVTCCMEDDEYSQILKVINSSNGMVILSVGTNNCDSYYPHFVADYNPKALRVTEKTKDVSVLNNKAISNSVQNIIHESIMAFCENLAELGFKPDPKKPQKESADMWFRYLDKKEQKKVIKKLMQIMEKNC